MKIKVYSFVCFLLLCITWTSCKEEEEIPPFEVNFSSSQVGLTNTDPSLEITVIFSRMAGQDGLVAFEISPGSLIYGQAHDFYTIPEAQSNRLEIPFQAGAEGVKFTINQGPGLNIQQEETITLSLLDEASGLYQPGQNTNLSIAFSENFVAKDGTIELNAGGESFSHTTFVDFSKLTQQQVEVFSWDLGFYTGDEHAVILNSSASTMARSLDKTDLTQVNAEDTLGWGNMMTIPPPGFDPSFGSVAWIDHPAGDLSQTAIGEISLDDAANKVFIIRRDGDRNWKKIRVLQDGESYILQYADIDAVDFNSLTIEKDPDFNFRFVDLDQGMTQVEPPRALWDIMYGTFTEILNLGPSGSIPYGFKDFIIINRYQTEVAMVMESDITYESFTAANLSGLEFKTEIDAIGENWRQGGGPNSTPSIQDDRFFILKDADNHMYKIKFTRLTSPNGERGYPELVFEKVE